MYRNLKRLILKRCELEHDQILQIAKSIKNSTLLRIEWQQSIEQNGIAQILVESDKLGEFIIFSIVTGPSNEEIFGRFPDKQIREKRKNPYIDGI